MSYIKRIIEADLLEKLSASGAGLIKGPKSCGKTETAKQFAKSILEIDRDKQVPVIMATNPQLLLAGDTPRLIDEWQEQPEIWNYVRQYLNLDPKEIVKWAGGPIAVIDAFGLLNDNQIRRYFELGCEVKALGRGHLSRLKREVREK